MFHLSWCFVYRSSPYLGYTRISCSRSVDKGNSSNNGYWHLVVWYCIYVYPFSEISSLLPKVIPEWILRVDGVLFAIWLQLCHKRVKGNESECGESSLHRARSSSRIIFTIILGRMGGGHFSGFVVQNGRNKSGQANYSGWCFETSLFYDVMYFYEHYLFVFQFIVIRRMYLNALYNKQMIWSLCTGNRT